jgi:hypothetical protein
MGHAPAKLFRPRRILASLAIGLVMMTTTTALLATFLFPRSSTVVRSPRIDAFPPTYLAPIAPPLTEISKTKPTSVFGGIPLLGTINPGVDSIEYSYGPAFWSDTYRPWDTTVTEEPPTVRLSRYRFGWPMRMLHMDDITTGQSIADPVVMAFHQRAYALAAHHRGLNRPAWIPSFIPLHRIPIAINWTGLAVNTACWGAVCFLLLSCRPLIRFHIHRRRARRGLCPTCRYELQSLPTCPECGQPNDPAAPPPPQQPVA